MKKLLAIILTFLCFITLTACREDDKMDDKEPVKIASLSGTWREIIDEKTYNWFEITIEDDVLTIYYCSPPLFAPNRKQIWSGSYNDPQEPFSELTFDSKQIDGLEIRTFNFANEVLTVEKLPSEADYEFVPTIRCKKLETETN